LTLHGNLHVFGKLEADELNHLRSNQYSPVKSFSQRFSVLKVASRPMDDDSEAFVGRWTVGLSLIFEARRVNSLTRACVGRDLPPCSSCANHSAATHDFIPWLSDRRGNYPRTSVLILPGRRYPETKIR